MADTTISQLKTVNALSATNYIPISDGTNTTKLGTDSLFGFRNRVINGDMRIDQRNNGAQISVQSGVPGFIVDRVYVANTTNVANVITASGQRVTVTDNGVPHDYAVRATIGNVTGRTLYDGRIQYNFEGNTVNDIKIGNQSATPLTASFWVRGSKNGRSNYFFWADDAGGTRVYFSKDVNITTSWQKIVIQIPPCTITGADIYRDNRRGFGSGLYWATQYYSTTNSGTWVTLANLPNNPVDDWSTSGDWIEFTGYQLEVGSTATPFERRPYGLELSLCYRYYFDSRNNRAGPSGILLPIGTGPSGYRVFLPPAPVAMRIVPAVVSYDINGNINKITEFSTNAQYNATPSPLSIFGAGYVDVNGNINAYGCFTYNAEL